jgi:site-specific DNA recombinase
MAKDDKKPIRCAIYTRKSSQEGLEQEFNSLDAQREAGEAYIKSQKHERWTLIPRHYDDGGFSGGTMDRPALNDLIADIKKGLIDVVVVYKVDRLSRSLHDFARLVEIFEKDNVSFVSVTQQFNTTSSMGRLTLNILLSFAQFEREVTGERIRDKIAASKKKGMWMGGVPVLGYDVKEKKLIVKLQEAETVRFIFHEYLASTSTLGLIRTLKEKGIRSKSWTSVRNNRRHSGGFFNKGMLYKLLHNRTYVGETPHKDKSYPGEHEAIIDRALFEAVQVKLKAGDTKNENNQFQTHGLLKGLVFDGEGRAYSPACSRRKGEKPGQDRFHRYYVSQKAIKEGYDTVKIRNIRMEDLDSLILANLRKSLSQSDFKGWGIMPLQQKRAFIRQHVSRIVIHESKIDLHIETATGIMVCAIPAQFRKYGGKKLIMDEQGKDILPASSDKDPALIKALVRARQWEKTFRDGDENSLKYIAETQKLGHRYVEKIYRLNFLSPQIKEAILDGNQPRTLTLSRLMSDIPLCWQEQARVYGF